MCTECKENIELYSFPAEIGDCLWLRFGNMDTGMKNILIDGGTAPCSYFVDKVIEKVKENKEKIDAVFLTHIDSDHIKGLLKSFQKQPVDVLQQLISSIYFNTSEGIVANLGVSPKEVFPAEKSVMIEDIGKGHSVRDAVNFLDILTNKGLKKDRKDDDNRLHDFIVMGDVISIGDATIKVISPSKECLTEFFKTWNDEAAAMSNKGHASSFPSILMKDLKTLGKEAIESENITITNKSSIAFLLEYAGKRMVFLGDADPQTCTQGVELFYPDSKYEADFIKLSHHGSSANYSDILFKKVCTNTYVLSTKGRVFKSDTHPGKQMMAYLVKENKDIHLLCNHQWWKETFNNRFFTVNDYEEYNISFNEQQATNSNKSKIDIIYLAGMNKPYLIKEGLNIYGKL